MPFADVPSIIAKDFTQANVLFQELTPAKLRADLQHDSLVHCTRLRGRHDVVSSLLKICLADIAVTRANAGGSEEGVGSAPLAYQQRRGFSSLKGCPLLILANGHTACFPKDGFGGYGGDQPVHIAPLSLHSVLHPDIRGSLLHPTALNDFPILTKDDAFKDTLLVKDMSASFIQV